MSFRARNWALDQRGLKPTTRMLLVCLCDHYNPKYGCFPSQETLARECQIARSSVNAHLHILENAGLIRRQPQKNRAKRRQPTHYYFAFEDRFQPTYSGEPCPKIGHGMKSRKRAQPCPDMAESHVRELESNLVIEPNKKRARERTGAVQNMDRDSLWAAWRLQLLLQGPQEASLRLTWVEQNLVARGKACLETLMGEKRLKHCWSRVRALDARLLDGKPISETPELLEITQYLEPVSRPSDRWSAWLDIFARYGWPWPETWKDVYLLPKGGADGLDQLAVSLGFIAPSRDHGRQSEKRRVIIRGLQNFSLSEDSHLGAASLRSCRT